MKMKIIASNLLGFEQLKTEAFKFAEEHGYLEKLQDILSGTFEVYSYLDEDTGMTALLWAARFGLDPYITQLLDRGAKIDQQLRFGKGRTSVMLAVEYNRPSTVLLLKNRGANLEVQFKALYFQRTGWTAIFFAVRERNLEMIKLLSALSANILHKDEDNQTIFDIALKDGSGSIVDYLMDNFPEAPIFFLKNALENETNGIFEYFESQRFKTKLTMLQFVTKFAKNMFPILNKIIKQLQGTSLSSEQKDALKFQKERQILKQLIKLKKKAAKQKRS